MNINEIKKDLNKISKDILIPLSIFLILLIGLFYFDSIPLKLFNIDINRFNPKMKIIYSLCCDLGFIIILFAIYKETLIDNFKKFIKDFKNNFDTCFKYYFIGLIIMVISNLIISIFFSEASANNENSIRALINSYPIYMLFSVSIYAPFTEELIFRKSIKDIFKNPKNNKIIKYLYVITSGLIFSSLHVIGMVNNNLDYLYIIPYLSLGISFAALYYKTDNIFSTMLMHSLHNTTATILLLITLM